MYSRQEDVQKTRYAMMKTAEFLEELEAYAKYTYELTKVDSAAIPDFGAGRHAYGSMRHIIFNNFQVPWRTGVSSLTRNSI